MADNKTSKKNELNMDNNDQMLEKEKMQETETKEKALQGANASLGENMLFGADSDEKDTEKTSFINKLYDEIASVLGADDANQFLCLTIPGQVVSAEDLAMTTKIMHQRDPQWRQMNHV